MGNQTSTTNPNNDQRINQIILQSFFMLDKSNYKATDVYDDNNKNFNIPLTIREVVSFLTGLKDFIMKIFPGTNIRINEKELYDEKNKSKYRKYIREFYLLQKEVRLVPKINVSQPSPPKKEINVNVYDVIYVFEKKNEFIGTLDKFISEFNKILSKEYSDIKSQFTIDGNDTGKIAELKTNIKSTMSTLVNNMMYFDFDFYVINYIEYMYTFYALHAFDIISKTYKRFKEIKELSHIDSYVTKMKNKKIQVSEKQYIEQIRGLIKIMQNPKDVVVNYNKRTKPKQNGGSNTTFLSQYPQNVGTTSLSTTEIPQLKSINEKYNKKLENFKNTRTQFNTFFKEVNELILKQADILGELYLDKQKDILTNEDTIKALNAIESKIDNENKKGIYDSSLMTIPEEYKSKFPGENTIALHNIIIIKKQIEDLVNKYVSSSSPSLTTSFISPSTTSSPLLSTTTGGFIKRLAMLY